MTAGHRTSSGHSTARHIRLPSLTKRLQGLGLKLTAHSRQKPAKPTSRVHSISTTPSRANVAEGSDASTSDSQQQEGTCWQPVLTAYAADRQSDGQPGKEVVRRSPAELLLWATEALDKQLVVVSDPSCELILRCSLSFSML